MRTEYTRYFQMLKANNPISFLVLVSIQNEGKIFLDMVPYVIINISTLYDEDKGNKDNGNTSNNNNSYRF